MATPKREFPKYRFIVAHYTELSSALDDPRGQRRKKSGPKPAAPAAAARYCGRYTRTCPFPSRKLRSARRINSQAAFSTSAPASKTAPDSSTNAIRAGFPSFVFASMPKALADKSTFGSAGMSARSTINMVSPFSEYQPVCREQAARREHQRPISARRQSPFYQAAAAAVPAFSGTRAESGVRHRSRPKADWPQS